MKSKANKKVYRPLGFESVLFLAFGLMMLSFSLIMFLPPIKINSIAYGTLSGIFASVFTFNVLGQKIVIHENKMYVYLWGINRWAFDLTYPHLAKMGFFYQDKIDYFLHGKKNNRKHFSIQVRTEKEKTCFPVDLYSTKQMRTIVFILNNSTSSKFNDRRLQGQEKYLINASLEMTIYSKEKRKHAHCEFCRKNFGNDAEFKSGYVTKDHHHWICKKCFEDFKDMFNFKVSKASYAAMEGPAAGGLRNAVEQWSGLGPAEPRNGGDAEACSVGLAKK